MYILFMHGSGGGGVTPPEKKIKLMNSDSKII